MSFGLQRSVALLTDLYQLTMAYGYWKSGIAEHEGAFHLFFRSAPFNGGFTIAAGLGSAVDFLKKFSFDKDDLEYLTALPDRRGKPLFEPGFLKYLQSTPFNCDVDAVPEGTVVFPQEPLVRVTGPLPQAQLIETMLLNIVNFQTLIATKAARICLVAGHDPVVEFGLRRAQGIDGGLSASRAAYIGGVSGTSNVLAGKEFGIPVVGTHAHSWVLCFGSELEAFRAYAEALPEQCVFLVDTYDSLQGVRNAVTVGHELRARGHELAGIRLDSGDLAYLSIEARKILDQGGFPSAIIVASNELDEHIISSLKQQRAAIHTWGVGTRLITAYDQPALGGVYKLTATRTCHGEWVPKLKLSEQTAKTSTPGIQQVRRFKVGKRYVGDAIYDATRPFPERAVIVDPGDPLRRKELPVDADSRDLLQPVFRRGQLIARLPELGEIRATVREELSRLHPGITRFLNPHNYPSGLELSLHERKSDLILLTRSGKCE
jgi:nicotinate phosphoribosyltransferase